VSRRAFFLGLLAVYAVILAGVTLTPGSESQSPSLIPFVEMWRELARSSRTNALANSVGNIALFVPLGWLIPMTWPRMRSLDLIVVAAVGLSVAIELSQFLFIDGRSPSTDDVILNTLGAAVGAIMFFAPRAA
jgi:glycopeptide antibiotics resistance protein